MCLGLTMLFRIAAFEIGKFYMDDGNSICLLVCTNVTRAAVGVGAVENCNLNC
jgi:hypothetical protein